VGDINGVRFAGYKEKITQINGHHPGPGCANREAPGCANLERTIAKKRLRQHRERALE